MTEPPNNERDALGEFAPDMTDKLLKALNIAGVVFLIIGGLALSPLAAALIVPIGLAVRLFGSPAALVADSPYE